MTDSSITDPTVFLTQTAAEVANLDPASLGIAVPGATSAETFGFVQSATALLNQIQHLPTPNASKSDQVARAFFRCYVYVDGDVVDSPYVQNSVQPAPIDMLRRLYHTVVIEPDRLSESHFFRALHNYVRDELLLRDEAFRQTEEYSRLVKEHIRKDKKKIGGAIQFKQRKCYNGLKICAPDWETADHHVTFLKDYVQEHKTSLPTEFSAFYDDDETFMSPPPAKRAKRAGSTPKSSAAALDTSPEASILPILTAVAAQQLHQSSIPEIPVAPALGPVDPSASVVVLQGNPILRVAQTTETCIVQILKPGPTSMHVLGPDERQFYNVKGTYLFTASPDEQTLWSNIPSGDFEFEFRVPPMFESPIAHKVSYDNIDGVLRMIFRTKQQQQQQQQPPTQVN